MGVWDALGRGIQGGVDAYLRGQERQAEEERRKATEALQQEQLALTRYGYRQDLSRYEDEQARQEQLRAEARHKELDPRSTEPGIHIPMFREISPGAFVPRSVEEMDQMYIEQREAYQAEQKGLADEEEQRRRREIEYSAQMGHKYSYPPAYAAEANKPEPSFFLNGEVNPLDAYAFLQNWIGRKGADPRSNPAFLETFLNDVALQYGQTVPNAREKAQAWLMQQSATPTVEQEPLGPPKDIFEQVGRAVPPTIDVAKKVPWPLGFGAPPPLPTGQQIVSTGKNIVNKIGELFTPSPSTGPAGSPPPTQAQLLTPQAQMSAGKSYEEFAAEKIAVSPYLRNQPAALQMLYQQYLSTLR